MDISKHVEYIKSRLKQDGVTFDIITLAVYEDDESLKYFRPNEPFESNAEHAAFVNAIAAELRADGVNVLVKVLKTSDYWRWLAANSRNDSDESRAMFISF